MPSQDRVWRHEGRHLTQDLASQPGPSDREATPVGVREQDPLLTELVLSINSIDVSEVSV